MIQVTVQFLGQLKGMPGCFGIEVRAGFIGK